MSQTINFPTQNFPSVYIPSIPAQTFNGSVPSGMQQYLYTANNVQQSQNAATLQGIGNLATLDIQNNGAYQAGINANQSQFYGTASNLAQFQANSISKQGKGK
jgi:hypothetical protein